MDQQRQRGAADPYEPLHGLLVLGIHRRLGGTSGVELALRPEACDAPPIGMAGFRVRLWTSEVPVVAPGVRKLPEGHRALDPRGCAADDPEDAAQARSPWSPTSSP